MAVSLRMEEEARIMSLPEKNHPISKGGNLGKGLEGKKHSGKKNWTIV